MGTAFRHLLLAPICFLLTLPLSYQIVHPSNNPLNPSLIKGIVNQTLRDGEAITWISSIGGLFAKETSFTSKSTGRALTLREVTDGTRLLQLIYWNGALSDCDDRGTEEGKEIEKEVNKKLNENKEKERGSLRIIPNWLDFKALRLECRKNHRETKRKARAKQNNKRPKRGIRDWTFFPGTNWCGPNNKAGKKNIYGPFSEADRCCRRHDRCQKYISPLSGKYNKYNYSPVTLSHCRCDRRFRTCLKMADTGASNLVGKLFFNIVQPRCFVIKPEKVCTKMSWWGKCQRFQYNKQAIIRRNFSY